jgi:hypothetical protein
LIPAPRKKELEAEKAVGAAQWRRIVDRETEEGP